MNRIEIDSSIVDSGIPDVELLATIKYLLLYGKHEGKPKKKVLTEYMPESLIEKAKNHATEYGQYTFNQMEYVNKNREATRKRMQKLREDAGDDDNVCPNIDGARKASRKPIHYSPEFEEWWKVYPSPRRTGKKAAWDSWQRTEPDRPDLETMLAKLAAQSKTAQWRKDNGQFIPLPSTYLNQHRWEDAVEASPVQQNWDDIARFDD